MCEHTNHLQRCKDMKNIINAQNFQGKIVVFTPLIDINQFLINNQKWKKHSFLSAWIKTRSIKGGIRTHKDSVADYWVYHSSTEILAVCFFVVVAEFESAIGFPTSLWEKRNWPLCHSTITLCLRNWALKTHYSFHIFWYYFYF